MDSKEKIIINLFISKDERTRKINIREFILDTICNAQKQNISVRIRAYFARKYIFIKSKDTEIQFTGFIDTPND